MAHRPIDVYVRERCGEAAAQPKKPNITRVAARLALSGSIRDAERIGRLRWLPSLTAISFLVPIVLLYWQFGGPSALLADPSTGVHIRTGQWILAHHAIPRRDLFSFTLARKSWCDWEWLSDVLFAGAYRLHGLSGVAALSLGLLCLTSVIIYRTARRHAGPIVAAATCGPVMAATTIHWLARPHLLTWLLLAALCWYLENRLCAGIWQRGRLKGFSAGLRVG